MIRAERLGMMSICVFEYFSHSIDAGLLVRFPHRSTTKGLFVARYVGTCRCDRETFLEPR